MKSGMLLLMVVALFSCNGGKHYTLTGKIDGTSAKEAYLEVSDKIDTVAVEDGVFVFKGSVEEPTMASLMIEGHYTNLMIENNKMTIEGAVERMLEAAITGSESQLVFDEFIKGYDEHKASREEYLGFCVGFADKYPDSYFTPYVISSIASMIPPQQVGDMLGKLSSEVKSGKVATELSTQINNVLSLAIGKTVLDFTMNDVDGKPVKLSNVYAKNKYLLIDFWASWCTPCRAENPNVVANYKKYHDKGFEVIGVSLDKKKIDWEKAIAADSLNWIQVSDLKGWQNVVAKQYAVRSIPTNWLVDSNGKIIARNLRGEKLGEKLSELLN